MIRIRHSHLPPSLEFPLTTVEWKQRFDDGKFDLTPSMYFKGHHQTLVFVVVPDCASKDNVNIIFYLAYYDY